MRGQILGSTRGIALVSVLWIAGLLAIMAASFVSASRTEARLARNLLENAKAEALADAGVHRAALAGSASERLATALTSANRAS